MGIDRHNLGLLAHAQDLGAEFQRTLTIGRQAVFVEDAALQRFQRLRALPALQGSAAAPGQAPYAEPLLQQWFGAREVASVDASAYEQATLIHDMNLPWPQQGEPGEPGDRAESSLARGRFDAVLDFGCLEHVFDFPTAWRNCVDLCRVGGHLLHALPANNLSGHGFYQFSPELFFNLYRPERGFQLKALFFALMADGAHWWRVASPLKLRRRVNLCNNHEVYILVLAQKLREPGPLPAPQQSDYAQAEWLKTGSSGGALPRPSRWQAPLAALGLLEGARRGREVWRAVRASPLALPGPDYERVRLAELLAARGR
jgi:SAM-dependent methyltransferase